MTATVVYSTFVALFVLSNIGLKKCDIFTGLYADCTDIRNAYADFRKSALYDSSRGGNPVKRVRFESGRKTIADAMRMGSGLGRFGYPQLEPNTALAQNVFGAYRSRVPSLMQQSNALLYPRLNTYQAPGTALDHFNSARDSSRPRILDFSHGVGSSVDVGPFIIAHGSGSTLTQPIGGYEG